MFAADANQVSIRSTWNTSTLAFQAELCCKSEAFSGAFGFLEDNKVRARSRKNGLVGKSSRRKTGRWGRR